MPATPAVETLSDKQLTLAKMAFAVALLFFILLQAYGIYFSELRMQLDAADDIIRYSATNSLLPPQPVFFRYAYVLNKLLLKPATLLHLPIQSVVTAYCINDLLFYLFIAFAIIYFTKRYDYAAAVLAAATLLPFSNFYYPYNELYLSGAIMVLYLAVYKHMQTGVLKHSILVIATLFIIWTHPAMLIVLMAFIPGLYISRKQLFDDKWLLCFIALNVVLRVILLSGYDHSHLQRINGAFNLQLCLHNCIDYLRLYWYLPVLAIYAFVRTRRIAGELSAYRGFVIVPLIIYLLGQNNVHMYDANFPKYIYPLNLLMLTLGLTALIRYNPFPQLRVLLAITIVFVISGAVLLSTFHYKLAKHAAVLKIVASFCAKEDPAHSKWYIRSNKLSAIDPLCTGINSESILFSTLAATATTVQVVHITDADTTAMKALPENEFYLNGLAALPISSLNTHYFSFKEGEYKEFFLDEKRLDAIRDAVGGR